MALFIEIRAADGSAARTRLDPGRNRLTVRLGDTYRIYDDQSGQTPPGAVVKRLDNSLIVDGLSAGAGGQAAPFVELADFYSVCSAGSPCRLVLDAEPSAAGGAASIVIDPGSAPIGALADGSFVLYDPAFAAGTATPPALTDGSTVRNVLYGLGGLAVVGVAIGGGGGGDGGGGSGPGGGGATDGALRLTSSPVVNDRTPIIAGEGTPGARVVMRIDTNGDGAANVTYATTVGPDGRWSVNLRSAAPESGGLPPGGLPDTANVGISQTVEGVLSNLPTFTLAFDGIPPAPAVIAAIASDNIVNSAEKQVGVVVSGTAEPGATVTVTLGTAVRTALVGAGGQWQTEPPFDATVITPDGNYTVSAVVTDPAGNVSGPAQVAVTVDTAPALLTVDPVAGDDRINATEAAGGVMFTGSANPNAAITISWNGVDRPVSADANGGWTVAFTPAEIPQTDAATFAYAIAAVNPAGNTGAASGSVLVDQVAPVAPVIGPVATDDIVNQPERTAGVTVAGTAEAGTTVTVVWGTQSANTVASGNGGWNTTFAAGAVPADGSYSLTAVATDVAGNASPAGSRAVAVNTVAPALNVVSVAGGDSLVAIADAASVDFIGTAAAGAAVTVNWNNVLRPVIADGTGTWIATYTGADVPTGDGVVIPYSATTVNAVGNSAVYFGDVTVDRVAPPAATTVAVDVDNNVIAGELFAVTGLAAAGTTVQVQIGAATLTATFTPGSTAWSAGPFLAPALPGGQVATVTVTDAAGNATPANTEFTVVPAGAFDSPGADAPVLSAVQLFVAPISDSGAGAQSSDAQGLANPIDTLVPLDERAA